MTVKAITILRHLPLALMALVFALNTTQAAQAQWTESDTSHAWSGFMNNFLYTDGDGFNQFTIYAGSNKPNGMWESAELLEMAEDGYVWAETNDPNDLQFFQDEVQSLADGFEERYGDNWWETNPNYANGDPFNDDLNWASIAMVRAFEVTGTQKWLTDAEANFNEVWARAPQADTAACQVNGDCNAGLCQVTNSNSSCLEDSAVNYTFVIVGRMIYNVTGTSSYAIDADSVYRYAVTEGNLYNSSNGEVPDSPGNANDLTYNYGIAIGAALEERDPTVITNAANWVMNDLSSSVPYRGVVNGQNILPYYGHPAPPANDNNDGFNGILLRYIGQANNHGDISSSVLAWAQANVSEAWANRDSDELMWDDWIHQTDAPGDNNPNSEVYSWDCSAALVGMLDLPTP